MVFVLLISCMYLKLTILLPDWKVESKRMDITFLESPKTLRVPCPSQTYL